MTPFAHTLRDYREQAGVTQYRLAKQCGYVPSYICRLESGNRNPSRKAIGKIANAIGADRDATTALYHAAGFLVPGEVNA